MNAPWILLFAKAPIHGTVKTRLAATIGPDRALEIYGFLAVRQMDAIRNSGLPCVIWTTPAGSEQDVAAWLPGAMDVRLQPEGDLGERMSHACAQAFANGAPGVILVGTDCPDLDSHRLLDIATEVSAGRFALQPAEDGGYVAFGLPKLCPAAFQGVAWSTDSVCNSTLRILRDLGEEPSVLESLSDIDTIEDWERCDFRRHPCQTGHHRRN